MNKFFVCIVLVLLLFAFSLFSVDKTNTLTEQVIEIEAPTDPLEDVPLLFSELKYKGFYSIEPTKQYLQELFQAKLELKFAINSEYYTISAIETMLLEMERIDIIINTTEIDIAKYTKWEQEHYYAAKVYEFLRQNGYSAEVACGIIGNMMIECGGFTLDLQPFAYNPQEHGGGLCGWLYEFYPEANGASFEKQCDILLNSIEYQFSVFDFLYYKGFSYEIFLTMTSPEDAALAFAKVYERCASVSYNMRQTAAREAYNYFVTDNKNDT